MDKLIVGCGYLGSRVARLWRDQGHTVRALTRGRAAQLSAEGIVPLTADLLKLIDLVDLPPAETVLFAVAPDRRTANEDPYAVWDRGLLHLLMRLRAWSTRPRFLFISSTGVYGQTNGEEVHEETLTEPSDGAGQTLLGAEELVREERGIAPVILRFAGIYGPGRLMRAATLQAGEPIAVDPEKWLNLIHVDDGAATVLAAEARATPQEIYNVGDGCPVRRRKFYEELARILGAPAPRFEAPSIGSTTARHDRANRRVSNRKMIDTLNVVLRYPSFKEGLAASYRPTRADGEERS